MLLHYDQPDALLPVHAQLAAKPCNQMQRKTISARLILGMSGSHMHKDRLGYNVSVEGTLDWIIKCNATHCTLLAEFAKPLCGIIQRRSIMWLSAVCDI